MHLSVRFFFLTHKVRQKASFVKNYTLYRPSRLRLQMLLDMVIDLEFAFSFTNKLVLIKLVPPLAKQFGEIIVDARQTPKSGSRWKGCRI